MAGKTTIREFQYDKDEFFEIVRAWALSLNFEVIEKRENYRLYHTKSLGLSVHGWLIAEHNGKVARLEAWSGPREDGNPFTVGNRLPIHENSFQGAIPRAQYKNLFNKLLDLFEEPRI